VLYVTELLLIITGLCSRWVGGCVTYSSSVSSSSGAFAKNSVLRLKEAMIWCIKVNSVVKPGQRYQTWSSFCMLQV
jgi:hypothetical protein